jgi:hypothetical protein
MAVAGNLLIACERPFVVSTWGSVKNALMANVSMKIEIKGGVRIWNEIAIEDWVIIQLL